MSRPCQRRRYGLTLIELLLALAGTAVIGAAIAAMLSAVTYGTSSKRDLRALVARGKTATGRLGAAMRSSVQVLDQGDGYIVLWTRDLDASDSPDLLELRRIQFDATGNQVLSYTAPTGTTDVAYALSDNFATITQNLIDAGTMTSELWVKDASAMQITLDNADPQSARLVSYRVTLTTGELSDTAIGVVHLRN